MVKIQEKKKTQQYTITIPRRIAEYMSWKKGTELVFENNTRDSVILRKKKF